MTRLILNLEKIPKPDDTADALAMAICHGHASGSLLGRLGNLRYGVTYDLQFGRYAHLF